MSKKVILLGPYRLAKERKTRMRELYQKIYDAYGVPRVSIEIFDCWMEQMGSIGKMLPPILPPIGASDD